MSYPLRIDLPGGPEAMAGVLSPSQMEAIRRNNVLVELTEAVAEAAVAYRRAFDGPGPWDGEEDALRALRMAVDRLISERGK